MAIDQTLRLLTRARGLSATDLAMAIPRAGVSTVSAWLRGEKLPGKEHLDALARLFGVPASALLAELASTFDPRNGDEQQLVDAYRALDARQRAALLEIATGLAGRRRPPRAARPASRRSK